MKKSITVQRQAHYYLSSPTKPVRSILFVLHGYAQLAGEFINEFHYLQDSSTLVVAPEALSKFYNRERKAVANWMTSHERIDEIEDYVNYLNQLYQKITSSNLNVAVGVLGFSQGVSTLFRWLCHTPNKATVIFACSGSIPPELNEKDFSGLSDARIFYFYGSQDRLLPVDKAQEQVTVLKRFHTGKVSPIEFAGRHIVSEETHQCIRAFSQSFDK
jgi:predicted esterase